MATETRERIIVSSARGSLSGAIGARPAAYAVLLLTVLAVRAMSWPISLIHDDEFVFILAGREVLAGHLPYTTLFDIKPVGPSVLLALAMGVMGQSVLAVRIFGAACVLATSILLYETVRLSSRRRIDGVAAGGIYIAYSTLFSGTATMTEIMLAPFSCLGALLLCRIMLGQPGRAAERWLMLGAGLAFGLSAWIKIVPVIPGVVLGAAVMLRRRGGGGILFLVGLAGPQLVTAAVYAAAGQFQAFAYANFGFMPMYMKSPGAGVIAMRLAAVVGEMWPLAVLAVVGLWLDLAAVARGRRADPFATLVYLWLGAEIVASLGPLRIAEHYFLMTMPPLAILAARMLARGSVSAGWAFAGSVALVALVPIVPTMRANAASVFKFPDSQRTTSAAVAALLPQDDRSLLVLSSAFMADYLYTGAKLPGRVAVPGHMLGAQTNLVGPDPVAPITAVLDTNPSVILVDLTDLAWMASPAQRAAVDRKLACCYREAANLREFWYITGGGTYHVADIRLFARIGPKG